MLDAGLRSGPRAVSLFFALTMEHEETDKEKTLVGDRCIWSVCSRIKLWWVRLSTIPAQTKEKVLELLKEMLNSTVLQLSCCDHEA